MSEKPSEEFGQARGAERHKAWNRKYLFQCLSMVILVVKLVNIYKMLRVVPGI